MYEMISAAPHPRTRKIKKVNWRCEIVTEVKITTGEKSATVFIKGDIDHHTAKEIREQIDSYLQEQAVSVLNLDFSGVQFMDSSGIGLIMGRYRLMKMLNGTIKVINIPEHLKRLIKISGLLGLGVIEKGEV